jgi:lipoprotein-releasing system permease protein
LNLELFIAKRITKGEKKGERISHPIITIAIIGIALGLSIMILSVAIVTGFKAEIKNKVIGFGSHIQITNYDNNSSFETRPINKNFIATDKILAVPGVKHLHPYATKPGILKAKNEIQGIVLNGVDANYDWDFFKENLVAGNTFLVKDGLKTNQILISEYLANLLHLEVGEKLNVYFIQQPPRMRRFTISGIYNSGMTEFDKLFVICDIGHIQKLNNWNNNQVSGYEVLLNSFDHLDEIEYQIRNLTMNQFTEDGSSLRVRSIKRRNPQIFSWLEMLNINVWIILTLMVLVAGFNMVSGLLIIILEKTNMIGILKALGTNNWSIRKIFLYQSGMLIGKGMLWGNILGISLCLLQYHFKMIPLDPTNYYVDTVPINFNLFHLLLLNIGTLIMTVAMLVLPSYIVTHISPSRAIKFE